LNEPVRYLKNAADQRDVDAEFNSRICPMKGQGVEIDLEEAGHYFEFAADQRIDDA
jgi:TPR repeat protein